MWWRKRKDEDFREEIEAHLAAETERLMHEGMSAEDAKAAARRRFGNVTRTQEQFYEYRRVKWLSDAVSDFRYGLRTVRRNRGFALIAILTLALGIGATTVMFSVMHALLLKPLPYADSERFVRLVVHAPQAQGAGMRRTAGAISAGELQEFRARVKTLRPIGIYAPALMTLTGGQEAVRIDGMRISAALWEMLGSAPRLGRTFAAKEDGDPVIVLSHTLWQRVFHGDPNILGRSLVLEDALRILLGSKNFSSRYTVIGVMPEGFTFPSPQAEFWIPFAPTGAGAGGLLAKLAQGASFETASKEIDAVLRELRPKRPNVRYEVASEQVEVAGPIREPLLVLMGAVSLLLVIACVNVANLLLARSVVRQREIAIRTALGSGWGRLVRQFVMESAVLSLLGGAAGAVFAYGGIHLLKRLASTLTRMDLGNLVYFPRLNEVEIDAPVLMFVLAVCAVTSVLFGLTPLLGGAVRRQLTALREGSGGSATRWGAGRRSALVTAEIAMATVLLAGGGVLIQSFFRLSAVKPGYDPTHVLTFQLALPGGRYPIAKLKSAAEELANALRSIPAVTAAAYAHQLPMVALRQTAYFRRAPALPPTMAAAPAAEDARLVSRGYFTVLRIPVKAGRVFSEGDGEGQPRVVVINESLARRDFAGENPIGKTVYLGRETEPWQVIGVVEDVRQFGFDRKADPQVFADFRQWPGTSPIGDVPQYFAVRTAGDPLAVLPDVRSVIRRFDAEAGVYNVATLEQLVRNSLTRPRLYAVLVGVFAGVSLTLAAIGIYGLIAYSVTQRTREIGIRMALGAPRWGVLRLVLRQSLWLTISGIGLGCAGATALARYLQGMVFGIEPLDPPTLIAVTVLFVSIAAVAAYAPARHATRVDPVTALRYE